MELICLNCGHEFKGTACLDNLGWHSMCPVCGSSFDVDVPDGRLAIIFLDPDTEVNEDFVDDPNCNSIYSYRGYPTMAELAADLHQIAENPDSHWYWVTDSKIDSILLSGACDPADADALVY